MSWDFVGHFGLQGVGFFVSIVLARILAPEDFGLLAIIAVFVNLAAVFMDFGFSTALIQRSEVTDSHYASVFYMNVVMGLVLALLVFFAAPFIAAFYDNVLLTNLVRFMSLSFIVSSFGNVMRARLRREMNFKTISCSNVCAAFISGAGAIYMAWAGYGVWSLAVQSVANQFLANVFLYFLSPMRINLRFSLQALKDLWAFSSRMFFSGLLDTLFINADSLIIGKALNTSTLGFYYRAKSLENFSFRYTASVLSSVLLPGLSSLQNDPDKLKHVVIKICHLVTFVSCLGCGLLLVTAPEIIILLFSNKWEPSVIMFQILISGAFASQLYNVFYNTFLSTGAVNTYFRINVLQKILLLLNFTTLFLGSMNIYLIIYAIFNVITLFVGIYYISIMLKLGHLLYVQTLKYLAIYCATVFLLIAYREVYPISNHYVSIIINTCIFSIIYVSLDHYLKYGGLKLVINEAATLIKRYKLDKSFNK